LIRDRNRRPKTEDHGCDPRLYTDAWTERALRMCAHVSVVNILGEAGITLPMTEKAHELNLDGIVGPTHSYAGLSYGNLASQRNRGEASNPKAAALEGLRKMKLLADLGVPQAVLPPQERPDVEALRRLGFGGTDAQVLERAGRDDPALLVACCSASGMWAANAATVSPSADTADGRVHFTPANLLTQFHRSLEPQTTARVLRTIFADENCFAHHPPLPAADAFADEGAANHIRLCPDYDRRGVEVFVYGRAALNPDFSAPRRYPARQTREACAAVARLHGLSESGTLLLRQNPGVIDAGAFHNDVVAVGNLNLLLLHAATFADGPAALDQIRRAYSEVDGRELVIVEVPEEQVPLADAIKSYLFNSQLVRLPDGTTTLIAPTECRENARVRTFLDDLVRAGGGPVRSVHFVDVRQSMRNGGGPACLRLRVALTSSQCSRVHRGVMLDSSLYETLVGWVHRHYRDQLLPPDLADPKLLDESRAALDSLTQILELGPIYRFQREPTS
jgi:succinylarginine dihydrolase